MLKFMLAILCVIPSAAFGATIYIDQTLGTNCTSGSYSVTNRSCTGNDGNAYNNIAAAHAAGSGGASNIFYLRAGSHTSNMGTTDGITATQNGQTWATYPGDLPTRAHITAGVTHNFIFNIQTWDNFTLKDLRLSGGIGHGVKMQNSSGSVIQDVEMFAFSTNPLFADDGSGGYNHGFNLGAHSGLRQDSIIVRRVYVHSPANAGANQGCIVGGSDGTSGWILEDNVVEDCPYGIWFDVGGGSAAGGNTPFLVRRNIARDIGKACYHIEARSSATFINNIGINCFEGLRIRPGNDLMQSVKFQNNTLYNFRAIGVWVQNDRALADTANINIDNNIFYSSVNANQALSVGVNLLSEPTNTFRNNVFHLVNNALGVCWGDAQGTSYGCEGTSYADSSAGIASWQSACSTCSGNVTGDPLFINGTAGNFNLQSASPAVDAGTFVGLSFNGSAPDIGALESGSVAPPPPPPPPAPSLTLPGRIEIESFMTGGEGVGYHEMTSANLGGAYRTSEAVDVKLAPGGAGYTIGYTDAGEWLRYDVNVSQSGNYTVAARGANGASTNGTFRVEVDGVNATGTIAIPPTGSYSTETTVNGPTISLVQGVRTLRVYIESGNFDLNWIEFNASSVGSLPASPTNVVVTAQ